MSVPLRLIANAQYPFLAKNWTLLFAQAPQLIEAISWLNNELSQSSYRLDSFEEDEKLVEKEMEEIREKIRIVDAKISVLELQIVDLEKYKTQAELALQSKWSIEAILEELLNQRADNFATELQTTNEKIGKLRRSLEKEYNVASKLRGAEIFIENVMAEIGNKFDFEPSYRPINLKFSLNSFDLWHEKNGRQIFLRSMGSGANWLYCHLALFLAIHRYFCSRGDACSVPSILFLDQPSQVYFPSALDNASKFDAKKLSEISGKIPKRPVDEDIDAVANLYFQLVKFCEDTLKETGIEPQLIVTDHADNLTLADDVQFEALVNGRRWRTRGFIEILSA